MNKQKGDIFVVIDLNKYRWCVTVRDPSIELFSGWIPGEYEAPGRILMRAIGSR